MWKNTDLGAICYKLRCKQTRLDSDLSQAGIRLRLGAVYLTVSDFDIQRHLSFTGMAVDHNYPSPRPTV